MFLYLLRFVIHIIRSSIKRSAHDHNGFAYFCHLFFMVKTFALTEVGLPNFTIAAPPAKRFFVREIALLVSFAG